MSFQTYDAMTAGRRADQPVDVLAALAGLVQFASRLRTCPPAALAFLRHADGLLRGTEAAPGVARTWAETVLFAEVSVREAQKELARDEAEAAAPAPAAAASSFSGFGDRLRSVFGPGDEARQRERLAAATAQLLEHWPRAAPPQPPPFARRAAAIEDDACGAVSGCGVQDTFFAAYRAEPQKVATPPGAEKKRKRRLDEVTTDVQRLDLAEQSTDMDAAAAARLVATAEAEITEGDDLLEGGAMVENAPCGEAAALKFHAACVRLEGVRCAAQHLPAALKRTAASELAYARRAAKTHAPLLENCVVERALYDARDADLRTISRQASAASDRPPQALFRRVDSLAELDASGRNRAQGCLDVLCALDVGVELPFAAAVDAADERLRHGAAASSGAPCAVGDKYVVDDELLGRGSYGVVRRCTRKSDGGQFACKTIRLRGGACWDRLHAEISAARKLDHPHICRLHEVFYEKQRVHLIFDLCTGGELWAFLTAGSPHGRRPRPLDEATAQRFAREMLSAVSYMHARGVCHRDLKPQNWLLASAAPGAPLKLVDFGLSRRVPEGLSRSLDDSSSCSSREALEEQLEAVVRAATSRDEQPEAAARATPPTPDPRAATPTPARASTPTPAAPATPRTAPASPLAPPPRIVANGPPSPGRKAPRTLSDAVTRRRSGSDLADLDMDDAEDDASARSSATRPRSPATVGSNGGRSENGHARRDRGRTGGLSDRVGSFYFVAPEVLRGGPRRALRPLVDGRHRLRAPERLPAVRGPHGPRDPEPRRARAAAVPGAALAGRVARGPALRRAAARARRREAADGGAGPARALAARRARAALGAALLGDAPRRARLRQAGRPGQARRARRRRARAGRPARGLPAGLRRARPGRRRRAGPLGVLPRAGRRGGRLRRRGGGGPLRRGRRERRGPPALVPGLCGAARGRRHARALGEVVRRRLRRARRGRRQRRQRRRRPRGARRPGRT